ERDRRSHVSAERSRVAEGAAPECRPAIAADPSFRHGGGGSIGPYRQEIGSLRGGHARTRPARHPSRCRRTAASSPLLRMAFRPAAKDFRHRRDGGTGADDVLAGETIIATGSTWRSKDSSRLAAHEAGLALHPANHGNLC